MLYLKDKYKVSTSRACRTLGLSRSTYYYSATPKNDNELREEMKVIACKRRRWGFPRICKLLKREGGIFKIRTITARLKALARSF